MARKPAQHSIVLNGINLAWVEWGIAKDPPLLLAHATGLHSRCWDQVALELAGYRVIAIDHRGHGRSDKKPPYDWSQFGADLGALVTALDLRDVNGVGHSMGAHSIVQAAANDPSRFRRLTLFDPVILSPSTYASASYMSGADHPVARRRNIWKSPQQMCENFAERKPFSRWKREVLQDYCQHGLVADGNEFKLACPPDIEAGIYTSSVGADITDRLVKVEASVNVIRAKEHDFQSDRIDFSGSPTWPDLASQFRSGTDIYLPEYSHFMPLENPALAAAMITRE